MASRDRTVGLRQPPIRSFSERTSTVPSVCVTPSPDEVISPLEYPVSTATSIDFTAAGMATPAEPNLLSVPGEPPTPPIKMRSRPRLSIPTLFPSTSWNSGGESPKSILTSMPSIPNNVTGGRRFSFSYIPMAIRRASWSIGAPSESMVSLSYRSLVNFVVEDNLIGLRGFLENRNVVVDDRDENGCTALLLAASKGKTIFVRELLNHGADANLEDNDNWTPLLGAAKEGHTTICAELLSHGADVNHKDMGGWTALVWASYKGHTDTMAVLIDKQADVNVHGQYHVTPLMLASGRGHTAIVRLLLEHGARVNIGDKYGTTALIWACRKGYTEIVDMLLQAGANVEVSGMNCWTPLLLSTKCNAIEIVNKLLEKKPNVNSLDKDGCTALTIACKEGYSDICSALIKADAYVNVQDRSGDTNLIHAAKAGHKGIVDILLKKYADVDMTGKERKTALYWAVEKSHVAVVKSLLTADPNLEIATKEGDTPLLRAVRNRNLEIVQLLLDKKARVTAADRTGDTALHIAMRARSKAIVEILLRNPKNSQLLYRPNRIGETPYNIDMSEQKTILGQIFGARRLNTNEDNENMLGYDLYSSALADMLSEPSLSMPITVGLYAKWGSGKSFLLSKLREEMKGFARQWIEPQFQFSFILVVVLLHVSALMGAVVGVSSGSWIAAVTMAAGFFFFLLTFLYIVYWGSTRHSWGWAHNISLLLAKRLDALKLVLQVTFCTPPGPQWGGDCLRIQPIRFYFTDQTKVSRSASGENSVVQMIGSLLDSIESDYGVVATRLYRAFRPKSLKSASPWRFRRFCCVPYLAIFIVCVDVLLAGLVLLILYLQGHLDEEILGSENALHAVLITIGVTLGVVMIANLYTWSRIVKSLAMSQRRKLQRSVARLHSVRAEGYLQSLKREVGILVEMVQCLDAFSGQQTRLVMVVDGLDSCEQDQVLYVLDAVHLLFTEQSKPFITLLAIDPHIIIKAIELNLHRMFNESNIGGHDYLRNLVHLPFYLQNAGLRKVKSAQQAALNARNTRTVVAATNSNAAVLNWLESDENAGHNPSSQNPKMPHHRGSSMKSTGLPGALGGRGKLRPSDSMESGLGGPPGNRGPAAHDLTKVLLTDDYFSDVNPRSMRRLMNVIYVTGRLLKAFQIEFNWYHLASWVNITEQWPYRTSWIILFCEVNEDKIDDYTTLKTVYERVKPYIPVSKEQEPFLEIDRDDKKFEIFLSFHRNTLQVLHLKMFMPFTIHLDPYLRKLIKEERPSFLAMQSGAVAPLINIKGGDHHHHHHHHHDPPPNGSIPMPWNGQPWTTVTLPTPDHSKPLYPKYPSSIPAVPRCDFSVIPSAAAFLPASHQLWFKSSLPSKLVDKMLSSFTAEDVGEMLRHLDGMRPAQIEQYVRTLTDNNISGRVLLHCDIDELKKLSGMTFGDWELFRIAVLSLRERELHPRPIPSPPPHSTLPAALNAAQFLDVDFDCRISRSSSLRSTTFPASANGEATETDSVPAAPKFLKRQNTIEKQVTLEDQAICGALQTLNEEAMEDVLDEREASDIAAHAESMGMLGYHSSNMSSCSDPAEMDVLYLQTSVIPDIPFPGLVQATSTLALGSRALLGREESVSIGSSLVSLAERGTATPARQRTVTEVVWPENIVTALNSGLRSRLSSNTSLFRAGSQKSVIDSSNYALGRRESQRSVSECLSKQMVPTTSMMESVVGLTAAAVTGGWRSEQGSPRRPASLVLSDSTSAQDWPMKSAQESPQGSASVLCTTPAVLSPPVPNQRFSTTHVELSPEQVTAKLETEKPPAASVKMPLSPSRKRDRRSGVSRTRAQAPLNLLATSKSRHNSSDDTSSDDAHEEAPLMVSRDSGGKSSHKSEIRILSSGAPNTATISKAPAGAGPSTAVPTGSTNSLASATGSSTSSLDSPVDTTDNEVYKTVIPKGDSRRENSLAFMLNRPLDSEAGKATAPSAAQDVRPSTPT